MLLDSLTSYWKLDEASGNRSDSHGANTLTDNATVGSGTGKLNNAGDFINANSEYLSLGANSAFAYNGTSAKSFSLWFKADALPGASRVIFSNWNVTTATRNFLLYTNSTSLILNVRDGGSILSTTVATDTWYHVVVTMDGSNSCKMYVNNSLIGTASGGTQGGTATTTMIGNQAGAGQYFDGLIDEVGWWTRVLSSTEVGNLYNSGNALAYEKFDAIDFIEPTITFFSASGVGPLNLLEISPSFFTQSATVGSPTIWSSESRPSTTWTLENKP